jgi:tetratricopeptide (TPR) repeat protein
MVGDNDQGSPKMNTVEQQISRYEEAVDVLAQASDAQFSSATLRALILRDKVSLALSDGYSAATPAALNRLTRSDQRVADLAVKVDSRIGRETLTNWRHSLNPGEHAWWWRLDDLADAKQPWARRFWTFFAVLFLTASLGLVADTFNVLRTVGANPVSTIGTLIQTALAFIAASAFTETGRKWLSEKVSYNRRFKGWARTVLALAILSITFVIWFYLPAFAARYFEHQGDYFLAEGLTQRAISDYQQAATLEPQSIKIHLALANAEERASDYGKAIEEYKSVVTLAERTGPSALDDSYYMTKIRLARLLILHAQSYRAALVILDDVQDKINQVSLQNRKLQQYFVLTYTGWAEFELKNFQQAEEINAAIRERENGAAAHYLLGRTLEELKDDAGARVQWVRFVKTLQDEPDQRDDVLPEWIGYAQEKLTKGT